MKHLLLVWCAAAPVVRAFGTVADVAPSPLPDPDAPIRIVTETESAAGGGFKLANGGDGCGCGWKPFLPPAYKNKGLNKKGKEKPSKMEKKCKQAAVWLNANRAETVKKKPRPLDTDDAAYPHLKGCRFRAAGPGGSGSLHPTATVYYNKNNDASGQEGSYPANYQLICEPDEDTPPSCAPADPGPPGACIPASEGNTNNGKPSAGERAESIIGYGGCGNFQNKMSDCKAYETVSDCAPGGACVDTNICVWVAAG